MEGGRASLRSDLEEVAIQIGQGIRTGGNQCMYCDRVGMLTTEPSLTIQTLEIKMNYMTRVTKNTGMARNVDNLFDMAS